MSALARGCSRTSFVCFTWDADPDDGLDVSILRLDSLVVTPDSCRRLGSVMRSVSTIFEKVGRTMGLLKGMYFLSEGDG